METERLENLLIVLSIIFIFAASIIIVNGDIVVRENTIYNQEYITLNNTIVKTEVVKETTIKEPPFNPEKQCISVHEPNATKYIWECNDIQGGQ